jgi:hypothetical protein
MRQNPRDIPRMTTHSARKQPLAPKIGPTNLVSHSADRLRTRNGSVDQRKQRKTGPNGQFFGKKSRAFRLQRAFFLAISGVFCSGFRRFFGGFSSFVGGFRGFFVGFFSILNNKFRC